jgi:enamine deaminase RidA (YjgF/YER057c/UK114 family)
VIPAPADRILTAIEPGASVGDRTPEDRLRELGIVLPPPPKPIANFVPYVQEGNLLFLSGQGPIEPGGVRHTGKVGDTVTIQEAYGHARITGINLLAVLQDAVGSLIKVRRIVKVLGMVNAAPDFSEHPRVINGCSDLLVSVFGDAIGRHARSAAGLNSLPGQITVELELIVALHAA